MPGLWHKGGMKTGITEKLIARQTPEAQAIIRTLLASLAKLEAEVEELRRQVKRKTPQNSSLPPSTRHPHAKPAPRKPKSKKKRGGQPGHNKHERQLIPVDRATTQTDRMSAVRQGTGGQRPETSAASGLGTARD
jgi:transposase